MAGQSISETRLRAALTTDPELGAIEGCDELLEHLARRLRDDLRRQRILEIDQALSRTRDLDMLLERILSAARREANADAGSVYILEDDCLLIRTSQNDTQQQTLAPGQKLPIGYFRFPISDATISGYVAAHKVALNIPDMYEIPADKPFSFDPKYDQTTGYRTVSSLTFPLVNIEGNLMGVLQLLNARDDEGRVIPFNDELEPFAMHFAYSATRALERAQMTRGMLLRMIGMAESRDPKETGAHVNRVGEYARELYEAWALKRGVHEKEKEAESDTLRMVAMLHDVGKVGVSDTVLKKPGRLDKAEWEHMMTHAWQGARYFQGLQSDMDRMAMDIALRHHENWDGSGYPGFIDMATGQALADAPETAMKGEEIPLEARIAALADVWDALNSRRVYKEAWEEQDVIDCIADDRGKKFDPELVDLFLDSTMLPTLRQIREKYPDAED